VWLLIFATEHQAESGESPLKVSFPFFESTYRLAADKVSGIKAVINTQPRMID
jgi:hypothetical protein